INRQMNRSQTGAIAESVVRQAAVVDVGSFLEVVHRALQVPGQLNAVIPLKAPPRSQGAAALKRAHVDRPEEGAAGLDEFRDTTELPLLAGKRRFIPAPCARKVHEGLVRWLAVTRQIKVRGNPFLPVAGVQLHRLVYPVGSLLARQSPAI